MCDSPSRTPSPAPLASFIQSSCFNLSIMQHNCANSNPIMISLFSSFNHNSSPVIVAIQEPSLYKDQPPPVPSYTLIAPPKPSNAKVLSCFYILTSFLNSISLVPLFFNRGDICGLSISYPDNGFRRLFKSVTIYNIYNKHSGRFSRSVPPQLCFLKSTLPTLVLGDFNIHHQSADPLRNFKRSELTLSSSYFDIALENNYALLNTSGSYTRTSPAHNQRSSVIDLCFANTALLPFIHSWVNNLPSSGSDHTVIQIQINPPNPPTANSSPQWTLTPWFLLEEFIKKFSPSEIEPSTDIAEWFDLNLNALTSPIVTITPKKRPSTWSKSWWNPDIAILRTIFHSVSRAYRKGLATPSEVKATKTAYLKSIKAAKIKHWNNFVKNASPKELWSINRLSKPKEADSLPSFPNVKSAVELNTALISHFFPPLHNPAPPEPHLFDSTPPITAEEITKALSKCSNLSTPGPDQIPYGTWKRIHSINPQVISALLTPLLERGHHRLSLKAANGIVLPKPSKPSYTDPSSFRIIVLWETISKLLERVVTFRLYDHAITHQLLHTNQGGSLPGHSTSDAATTLVHEVKLLQFADLKVSTFFLDIKGGFDNVRAPILASRLRKHNTPDYIVNWVLSFLANRSCRLLFKGGPKQFQSVEVGVPQGSPISPLLFVIYVAPLHSVPLSKGLTLSYVDDFALTKASPSYRSNVRHLQAAWVKLQSIGDSLHISFSIPKTNFIHWRTLYDRNPTPTNPISLNNNISNPLPHVKWLGMWFSAPLTTHYHYQQRLAKGIKTFGWLKTHSRPGSGLTAINARRLAQAVILPIMLYGSTVLQPKTASLIKLSVLWMKVLRWVTNCFDSTNNNAVYPEAALMPLESYCLKYRIQLAKKVCTASPHRNPLAARLAYDFPLPDKYRTKTSFRHLLAGHPNLPRNWNQEPKVGRTFLPIDQLAHLFQQTFLSLVPDGVIGVPFTITNMQIQEIVLLHWKTIHPPPIYYQFEVNIKPHLFMSYDKFISGRLHQFRACKSYLASHQPYYNYGLSTTCPRCHQGE